MRAASSLLVLLALARVATAETADEAFNRGRDLLKAEKWAEACDAFETSQRLDPSNGTRFNIAQCSEKLGKLATALAIYKELAAKDTNAQRKATSAELAAKLEPRVPKLQLQIDPRPAGLVATIDGKPCGRCDKVPVDLGTHTVAASAPAYRMRSAQVTITDEATVVVFPLQLEREPAPTTLAPAITAPVASPPLSPAEPPRSRRKTYAVIAIAAGGVGLGTGIVFGVLARNGWNDAKAVCGGSTTCPDPVDTDRANALADDARSRGNISTALVIAGGAIAATGVVLWVTAPSRRDVRVGVAPAHRGIAVSGRF